MADGKIPDRELDLVMDRILEMDQEELNSLLEYVRSYQDPVLEKDKPEIKKSLAELLDPARIGGIVWVTPGPRCRYCKGVPHTSKEPIWWPPSKAWIHMAMYGDAIECEAQLYWEKNGAKDP